MKTRKPAPATDIEALPLLLTAEEVGSVLRTTRAAVYTMIERAQLPGVVRIGRRVLVNRDELMAWLAGESGGRIRT